MAEVRPGVQIRIFQNRKGKAIICMKHTEQRTVNRITTRSRGSGSGRRTFAWSVEEMYAGIGGQGTEDAAYASAVLLEHCHLRDLDATGGAADIFKCFDQVNRVLV